MASETRTITKRPGLELQPMAIVSGLSVAEQQMVEIARALSMKSRLIVMDEPTSALSLAEVDKLFRIARELKAQGLSIIFVTHRLEEVMQICDRYTPCFATGVWLAAAGSLTSLSMASSS